MSSSKSGRSNRQGAAFVCTHVAIGRRPILFAERSEPVEAVDSGWQFLCGLEEDHGTEAQIWSLQEVINADLSLAQLVDLPVGTRVVRSTVTATWEIVPPERDRH
jgi:hypothetical protein